MLADTLHVAMLFAPALITWCLWAFVLTINQAWDATFSSYWPMSIALVFGSLLAGSTPCSAGVVIYPVTQLAPLHPAPDSRDASLLLQAVGLAAATYTILHRKPELLHGTGYMLFFFCTVGAVGVIAGFTAALARDLANTVFTSTVFAFAMAYFYASEVLLKPVPAMAPSDLIGRSKQEQAARSDTVMALLACVCAMGGGFLAGTIGTGADIACYAFGIFCWNVRHPRLALDGAQLTATAVVVMAFVSIFASLVRALVDGGFSRPTLLCWGAMVPVVVVGAPVGSLVLSPTATTGLRRLFYCLASTQFACYLIFAPTLGSPIWRLVAGALVVEAVALACHFVLVQPRSSRAPSPSRGDEINGKPYAHSHKGTYSASMI